MPPNFDYWDPDSDWVPTTLGGRIVTEMTLAALDQVCWHLLCCDFLFDVIEEESDVVFHQVAADVEQGRFRAEALFEAASRRYRAAPGPSAPGSASAAVPEYSGAGTFLGAFERQFEGDSPVIDGTTVAHKITGGVAGCAYLLAFSVVTSRGQTFIESAPLKVIERN
jgi:hypothetical protein